jgi:hypothetical protein
MSIGHQRRTFLPFCRHLRNVIALQRTTIDVSTLGRENYPGSHHEKPTGTSLAQVLIPHRGCESALQPPSSEGTVGQGKGPLHPRLGAHSVLTRDSLISKWPSWLLRSEMRSVAHETRPCFWMLARRHHQAWNIPRCHGVSRAISRSSPDSGTGWARLVLRCRDGPRSCVPNPPTSLGS